MCLLKEEVEPMLCHEWIQKIVLGGVGVLKKVVFILKTLVIKVFHRGLYGPPRVQLVPEGFRTRISMGPGKN